MYRCSRSLFHGKETFTRLRRSRPALFVALTRDSRTCGAGKLLYQNPRTPALSLADPLGHARRQRNVRGAGWEAKAGQRSRKRSRDDLEKLGAGATDDRRTRNAPVSQT
jgi:hypothetical protein